MSNQNSNSNQVKSAVKRLNRIAKRACTRDNYKGRTVSNTSAIKRVNRA